jgi:hypothetical protein
MESNRQMNDWIVRYGFLLKKRNSDKQKDKFIRTFLSDVLNIRDDIIVIEIEGKKRKYHNIYIGDVSKADKIITTYFDTPIVSFGDYSLTDTEKNKRNSLSRIAFESVVSLCIGLGIFFFLMRVFEGTLLTTVLTVFALAFFYVFNGIVKGRASSKTQVRNTSSLVLVLSLLAKYKGNKKVAFAIVDGGCTNEIGLVALKNSVKIQSKIYELDSVGANTTLIVTEASDQKSFKIHPNLERLGNAILSEKIDDVLLTRQRQEIETILEER